MSQINFNVENIDLGWQLAKFSEMSQGRTVQCGGAQYANFNKNCAKTIQQGTTTQLRNPNPKYENGF